MNKIVLIVDNAITVGADLHETIWAQFLYRLPIVSLYPKNEKFVLLRAHHGIVPSTKQRIDDGSLQALDLLRRI